MLHLRISFLFLVFAVSGYVHAQESPALVRIKNEVRSMADDPVFQSGQVGFSLRSVEGKELYDFNGSKSLVPASNLKLLTTATALQILGEDFRYETKLYYDGILKDGIVNGNLYIEGSGDPTLGSDRIEGNPDMDQLFQVWTEKLKEVGIRKVNGSVIPVSGIFERNSIPDRWIWTDIGNYYGAGAFGLNINENLYKLIFKPGKTAGEPTEVLRTEPFIPGITFENEVKTGSAGSGDHAYIFGSPFSYYRYLSGTVPAGVAEFTIKGSIPDPGLLCAYLFHKRLGESGVEISGDPSDKREALRGVPSGSTLIFTHRSPELKEIIRYTNFYSINLYAEALLKTIAVKKGFSGSDEKAVELVEDHWRQKGVDVRGMFLYDGSGLSPQTAVQPSQMTQMLYLMNTDSIYYASIPVAGESGTLRRFCKGTSAEKKICAKSGTLSKVVCYSGYVKSKNGKLNSFSIFINNYQGSYSSVITRIEKLMVLITEI